MKSLVVGALLLGALYVLVPMAGKLLPEAAESFEESPESAVERRVEPILAGLAEPGNSVSQTAQTAVCQWYRGAPFISDRAVLSRALDEWDRWRREKNLYSRTISKWEITKIEMKTSRNGEPYARVTVKSDVGILRLKVAEGKRVSWG